MVRGGWRLSLSVSSFSLTSCFSVRRVKWYWWCRLLCLSSPLIVITRSVRPGAKLAVRRRSVDMDMDMDMDMVAALFASLTTTDEVSCSLRYINTSPGTVSDSL